MFTFTLGMNISEYLKREYECKYRKIKSPTAYAG